MRALVAIKRVVDYSAQKIREAANLKDQKKIKSITALSIGPAGEKKVLYGPLALGADKAIYVNSDLRHDTLLQPLIVAKTLKHFIERDKYDIVLLGKQSVDDDSNQTGQLLAGLMGWAQATFASKILLTDTNAEVTREVDSGLQTVRLKLPAVITCDLRLNTPKIASLTAMMKAKKMPIEEVDFKSLNIPKTNLEILETSEPPKRKGGVMVKDVDELIEKLTK